MIVHLIASKSNAHKDQEQYKLIVSTVKQQGHTFANDWLDAALAKVPETDYDIKGIDWAEVDRDNIAAISRADVVIVETSDPTFFVGYQAAQAVALKKPLLILTSTKSGKGNAIAGLSSAEGFIESTTYDSENIAQIISRFMEINDIATKDMRFNFFIDRPIYNYLRWTALRTGKTKAEILRELVEREIDRSSS